MVGELVSGGVVVLLCAGWCVVYLKTAWNARGVRYFEQVEPAELDGEPPCLTVIVPACNEAATIAAALEKLKAQTYPALQVLVVDDRSTDDTGAIVDRIAAEDERFEAIHIDELPDGWLGKVHAMHRATELADGEWLLFTDADVEFAPDTLDRAVRLALGEDLDHLAVIPYVLSHGVALEAVVSAFGALLLGSAEIPRVREPDQVVPFGVGAFNLVRRSAFDRTPGFEWLRMEVADDFGLGLMLAREGARQDVLVSHRDIAVEWYESVGSMIRGLEKNLFAVAGKYSLLRVLIAVPIGVVFVFAPVIALEVPGGWPGAVASGAAVFSMLLSTVVLARATGRRWAPLLFLPLTQLLVVYALLRSAIVGTVNDGITWRGTHYPLDELRRHRRVDL